MITNIKRYNVQHSIDEYSFPKDREKFEVSQNRTMIIWDPEKCGINDQISILDYLGPTREQKDDESVAYTSHNRERKIAEGKPKTKKK